MSSKTLLIANEEELNEAEEALKRDSKVLHANDIDDWIHLNLWSDTTKHGPASDVAADPDRTNDDLKTVIIDVGDDDL